MPFGYCEFLITAAFHPKLKLSWIENSELKVGIKSQVLHTSAEAEVSSTFHHHYHHHHHHRYHHHHHQPIMVRIGGSKKRKLSKHNVNF